MVFEGAGIRSVREALETSGPQKPFAVPVWAGTTLATAVFANTPPPPNLRRLVSRIAARPAFFIFATKGQGGEQLSSDFYEAAREPKEL